MSFLIPSENFVDFDQEEFERDSSLGISTGASSLGSSPPSCEKRFDSHRSSFTIEASLPQLFGENVAAKIWRVANSWLDREVNGAIGELALDSYPEHIPTFGENAGKYISKPAAFWTCGFFPASLYCLLERSMQYPKTLPAPNGQRLKFHKQLLQLCRTWSAPLHKNVTRTNTHDMGFITHALRMDWELTSNTDSLHNYMMAANSLATRYDHQLGAIRSWDRVVSKRYDITDKDTNFVIIIDSMCNMDLLFYAGHHLSDQRLIDIAISHAHTIIRTIVRSNGSSFHFANLDPRTGDIKAQMTHQGYSDSSTWSRGQAWGILGFTQTYMWTKNTTFLATALSMADYFLAQLSNSSHPSPYVPLWDFDARIESDFPLRDSSAGMIAANGLLLLHQALNSSSPYLAAAMRIAEDTIAFSLSQDEARFKVGPEEKITVDEGSWDGILTHATASNNEYALQKYGDHGLVYADYYFLEFGNKLMRMRLA